MPHARVTIKLVRANGFAANLGYMKELCSPDKLQKDSVDLLEDKSPRMEIIYKYDPHTQPRRPKPLSLFKPMGSK